MDDNARVADGLKALRDVLFRLHKVLIESERREYERVIGKIESPSEFVRLLMNDAWFSWLRPYSALIVAMDEALEPGHELTVAQRTGFIESSRELLAVEDEGEDGSSHYFVALQRDPDVVLAHAEAMQTLRSLK